MSNQNMFRGEFSGEQSKLAFKVNDILYDTYNVEVPYSSSQLTINMSSYIKGKPNFNNISGSNNMGWTTFKRNWEQIAGIAYFKNIVVTINPNTEETDRAGTIMLSTSGGGALNYVLFAKLNIIQKGKPIE